MQKWKNYSFESSSKTPEFIAFSKDFKKAVKKAIKPCGASLISYSIGHFYVSGFVKRGEKFVYFAINNVRGGNSLDSILVRTAKDGRDYAGGSNNFCRLEEIGERINKLLS